MRTAKHGRRFKDGLEMVKCVESSARCPFCGEVLDLDWIGSYDSIEEYVKEGSGWGCPGCGAGYLVSHCRDGRVCLEIFI